MASSTSSLFKQRRNSDTIENPPSPSSRTPSVIRKRKSSSASYIEADDEIEAAKKIVAEIFRKLSQEYRNGNFETANIAAKKLAMGFSKEILQTRSESFEGILQSSSKLKRRNSRNSKHTSSGIKPKTSSARSTTRQSIFNELYSRISIESGEEGEDETIIKVKEVIRKHFDAVMETESQDGGVGNENDDIDRREGVCERSTDINANSSTAKHARDDDYKIFFDDLLKKDNAEGDLGECTTNSNDTDSKTVKKENDEGLTVFVDDVVAELSDALNDGDHVIQSTKDHRKNLKSHQNQLSDNSNVSIDWVMKELPCAAHDVVYQKTNDSVAKIVGILSKNVNDISIDGKTMSVDEVADKLLDDVSGIISDETNKLVIEVFRKLSEEIKVAKRDASSHTSNQSSIEEIVHQIAIEPEDINRDQIKNLVHEVFRKLRDQLQKQSNKSAQSSTTSVEWFVRKISGTNRSLNSSCWNSRNNSTKELTNNTRPNDVIFEENEFHEENGASIQNINQSSRRINNNDIIIDAMGQSDCSMIPTYNHQDKDTSRGSNESDNTLFGDEDRILDFDGDTMTHNSDESDISDELSESTLCASLPYTVCESTSTKTLNVIGSSDVINVIKDAFQKLSHERQSLNDFENTNSFKETVDKLATKSENGVSVDGAITDTVLEVLSQSLHDGEDLTMDQAVSYVSMAAQNVVSSGEIRTFIGKIFKQISQELCEVLEKGKSSSLKTIVSNIAERRRSSQSNHSESIISHVFKTLSTSIQSLNKNNISVVEFVRQISHAAQNVVESGEVKSLVEDVFTKVTRRLNDSYGSDKNSSLRDVVESFTVKSFEENNDPVTEVFEKLSSTLNSNDSVLTIEEVFQHLSSVSLQVVRSSEVRSFIDNIFRLLSREIYGERSSSSIRTTIRSLSRKTSIGMEGEEKKLNDFFGALYNSIENINSKDMSMKELVHHISTISTDGSASVSSDVSSLLKEVFQKLSEELHNANEQGDGYSLRKIVRKLSDCSARVVDENGNEFPKSYQSDLGVKSIHEIPLKTSFKSKEKISSVDLKSVIKTVYSSLSNEMNRVKGNGQHTSSLKLIAQELAKEDYSTLVSTNLLNEVFHELSNKFNKNCKSMSEHELLEQISVVTQKVVSNEKAKSLVDTVFESISREVSQSIGQGHDVSLTEIISNLSEGRSISRGNTRFDQVSAVLEKFSGMLDQTSNRKISIPDIVSHISAVSQEVVSFTTVRSFIERIFRKISLEMYNSGLSNKNINPSLKDIIKKLSEQSKLDTITDNREQEILRSMYASLNDSGAFESSQSISLEEVVEHISVAAHEVISQCDSKYLSQEVFGRISEELNKLNKHGASYTLKNVVSSLSNQLQDRGQDEGEDLLGEVYQRLSQCDICNSSCSSLTLFEVSRAISVSTHDICDQTFTNEIADNIFQKISEEVQFPDDGDSPTTLKDIVDELAEENDLERKKKKKQTCEVYKKISELFSAQATKSGRISLNDMVQYTSIASQNVAGKSSQRSVDNDLIKNVSQELLEMKSNHKLENSQLTNNNEITSKEKMKNEVFRRLSSNLDSDPIPLGDIIKQISMAVVNVVCSSDVKSLIEETFTKVSQELYNESNAGRCRSLNDVVRKLSVESKAVKSDPTNEVFRRLAPSTEKKTDREKLAEIVQNISSATISAVSSSDIRDFIDEIFRQISREWHEKQLSGSNCSLKDIISNLSKGGGGSSDESEIVLSRIFQRLSDTINESRSESLSLTDIVQHISRAVSSAFTNPDVREYICEVFKELSQGCFDEMKSGNSSSLTEISSSLPNVIKNISTQKSSSLLAKSNDVVISKIFQNLTCTVSKSDEDMSLEETVQHISTAALQVVSVSDVRSFIAEIFRQLSVELHNENEKGIGLSLSSVIASLSKRSSCSSLDSMSPTDALFRRVSQDIRSITDETISIADIVKHISSAASKVVIDAAVRNLVEEVFSKLSEELFSQNTGNSICSIKEIIKNLSKESCSINTKEDQVREVFKVLSLSLCKSKSPTISMADIVRFVKSASVEVFSRTSSKEVKLFSNEKSKVLIEEIVNKKSDNKSEVFIEEMRRMPSEDPDDGDKSESLRKIASLQKEVLDDGDKSESLRKIASLQKVNVLSKSNAEDQNLVQKALMQNNSSHETMRKTSSVHLDKRTPSLSESSSYHSAFETVPPAVVDSDDSRRSSKVAYAAIKRNHFSFEEATDEYSSDECHFPNIIDKISETGNLEGAQDDDVAEIVVENESNEVEEDRVNTISMNEIFKKLSLNLHHLKQAGVASSIEDFENLIMKKESDLQFSETTSSGINSKKSSKDIVSVRGSSSRGDEDVMKKISDALNKEMLKKIFDDVLNDANMNNNDKISADVKNFIDQAITSSKSKLNVESAFDQQQNSMEFIIHDDVIASSSNEDIEVKSRDDIVKELINGSFDDTRSNISENSESLVQSDDEDEVVEKTFSDKQVIESKQNGYEGYILNDDEFVKNTLSDKQLIESKQNGVEGRSVDYILNDDEVGHKSSENIEVYPSLEDEENVELEHQYEYILNDDEVVEKTLSDKQSKKSGSKARSSDYILNDDEVGHKSSENIEVYPSDEENVELEHQYEYILNDDEVVEKTLSDKQSKKSGSKGRSSDYILNDSEVDHKSSENIEAYPSDEENVELEHQYEYDYDSDIDSKSNFYIKTYSQEVLEHEMKFREEFKESEDGGDEYVVTDGFVDDAESKNCSEYVLTDDIVQESSSGSLVGQLSYGKGTGSLSKKSSNEIVKDSSSQSLVDQLSYGKRTEGLSKKSSNEIVEESSSESLVGQLSYGKRTGSLTKNPSNEIVKDISSESLVGQLSYGKRASSKSKNSTNEIVENSSSESLVGQLSYGKQSGSLSKNSNNEIVENSSSESLVGQLSYGKRTGSLSKNPSNNIVENSSSESLVGQLSYEKRTSNVFKKSPSESDFAKEGDLEVTVYFENSNNNSNRSCDHSINDMDTPIESNTCENMNDNSNTVEVLSSQSSIESRSTNIYAKPSKTNSISNEDKTRSSSVGFRPTVSSDIETKNSNLSDIKSKNSSNTLSSNGSDIYAKVSRRNSNNNESLGFVPLETKLSNDSKIKTEVSSNSTTSSGVNVQPDSSSNDLEIWSSNDNDKSPNKWLASNNSTTIPENSFENSAIGTNTQEDASSDRSRTCSLNGEKESLQEWLASGNSNTKPQLSQNNLQIENSAFGAKVSGRWFASNNKEVVEFSKNETTSNSNLKISRETLGSNSSSHQSKCPDCLATDSVNIEKAPLDSLEVKSSNIANRVSSRWLASSCSDTKDNVSSDNVIDTPNSNTDDTTNTSIKHLQSNTNVATAENSGNNLSTKNSEIDNTISKSLEPEYTKIKDIVSTKDISGAFDVRLNAKESSKGISTKLSNENNDKASKSKEDVQDIYCNSKNHLPILDSNKELDLMENSSEYNKTLRTPNNSLEELWKILSVGTSLDKVPPNSINNLINKLSRIQSEDTSIAFSEGFANKLETALNALNTNETSNLLKEVLAKLSEELLTSSENNEDESQLITEYRDSLELLKATLSSDSRRNSKDVSLRKHLMKKYTSENMSKSSSFQDEHFEPGSPTSVEKVREPESQINEPNLESRYEQNGSLESFEETSDTNSFHKKLKGLKSNSKVESSSLLELIESELKEDVTAMNNREINPETTSDNHLLGETEVDSIRDEETGEESNIKGESMTGEAKNEQTAILPSKKSSLMGKLFRRVSLKQAKKSSKTVKIDDKVPSNGDKKEKEDVHENELNEYLKSNATDSDYELTTPTRGQSETDVGQIAVVQNKVIQGSNQKKIQELTNDMKKKLETIKHTLSKSTDRENVISNVDAFIQDLTGICVNISECVDGMSGVKLSDLIANFNLKVNDLVSVQRSRNIRSQSLPTKRIIKMTENQTAGRESSDIKLSELTVAKLEINKLKQDNLELNEYIKNLEERQQAEIVEMKAELSVAKLERKIEQRRSIIDSRKIRSNFNQAISEPILNQNPKIHKSKKQRSLSFKFWKRKASKDDTKKMSSHSKISSSSISYPISILSNENSSLTMTKVSGNLATLPGEDSSEPSTSNINHEIDSFYKEHPSTHMSDVQYEMTLASLHEKTRELEDLKYKYEELKEIVRYNKENEEKLNDEIKSRNDELKKLKNEEEANYYTVKEIDFVLREELKVLSHLQMDVFENRRFVHSQIAKVHELGVLMTANNQNMNWMSEKFDTMVDFILSFVKSNHPSGTEIELDSFDLYSIESSDVDKIMSLFEESVQIVMSSAQSAKKAFYDNCMQTDNFLNPTEDILAHSNHTTDAKSLKDSAERTKDFAVQVECESNVLDEAKKSQYFDNFTKDSDEKIDDKSLSGRKTSKQSKDSLRNQINIPTNNKKIDGRRNSNSEKIQYSESASGSSITSETRRAYDALNEYDLMNLVKCSDVELNGNSSREITRKKSSGSELVYDGESEKSHHNFASTSGFRMKNKLKKTIAERSVERQKSLPEERTIANCIGSDSVYDGESEMSNQDIAITSNHKVKTKTRDRKIYSKVVDQNSRPHHTSTSTEDYSSNESVLKATPSEIRDLDYRKEKTASWDSIRSDSQMEPKKTPSEIKDLTYRKEKTESWDRIRPKVSETKGTDDLDKTNNTFKLKARKDDEFGMKKTASNETTESWDRIRPKVSETKGELEKRIDTKAGLADNRDIQTGKDKSVSAEKARLVKTRQPTSSANDTTKYGSTSTISSETRRAIDMINENMFKDEQSIVKDMIEIYAQIEQKQESTDTSLNKSTSSQSVKYKDENDVDAVDSVLEHSVKSSLETIDLKKKSVETDVGYDSTHALNNKHLSRDVSADTVVSRELNTNTNDHGSQVTGKEEKPKEKAILMRENFKASKDLSFWLRSSEPQEESTPQSEIHYVKKKRRKSAKSKKMCDKHIQKGNSNAYTQTEHRDDKGRRRSNADPSDSSDSSVTSFNEMCTQTDDNLAEPRTQDEEAIQFDTSAAGYKQNLRHRKSPKYKERDFYKRKRNCSPLTERHHHHEQHRSPCFSRDNNMKQTDFELSGDENVQVQINVSCRASPKRNNWEPPCRTRRAEYGGGQELGFAKPNRLGRDFEDRLGHANEESFLEKRFLEYGDHHSRLLDQEDNEAYLADHYRRNAEEIWNEKRRKSLAYERRLSEANTDAFLNTSRRRTSSPPFRTKRFLSSYDDVMLLFGDIYSNANHTYK